MSHCRRNWSDFQPELLELILQRLPLMDYLKCRQVCSSWQTIVEDALATKHRCPFAPHFPFLLLLPFAPSPANLFSLTQHQLYTLPTKTWKCNFNKVCWVRSVDGWLMFLDSYRQPNLDQGYSSICSFSFFNPVSRDKFELPKLPLFSGWEFISETFGRAVRVVFSSTPDSPEFYVAIITVLINDGDFRKPQVAFCKVIDKSWTFIDTDETRSMIFHDIAFVGSKLYACTEDVMDFLIVFDLNNPNGIIVERVFMLDPKLVLNEVHFEVKDGLQYFIDNEGIMLVRDNACGELFLVLHLHDKIFSLQEREYLHWTKAFRVFRLDMSGPRWLEIDNLGDCILLYDCSGASMISAKDINCPGELTGGNCIYFSVRNTLSIDSFPKLDVGVFSLKDKSIRRFPLDSSLQVCARSLWFMPSPW